MQRLTSLDIKDYLKSVIDSPDWYIGQMDKDKEKAIAIYANKREIQEISKYKNLQTYSILPITILIRWTKNYKNAENKANEIFDLLDCKELKIRDLIAFTECVGETPHDLGADENGVFKFSIEVNFIYIRRR